MSKKISSKDEKKTLFSNMRTFIKSRETQINKRINIQLREKIKMPFKIYKGIKKSNIDKIKKLKDEEKINNIIGQSKINEEKLMLKIIKNREENNIKNKKNSKLKFSRSKEKSRFKNGVLKIGKNFLNNLNK